MNKGGIPRHRWGGAVLGLVAGLGFLALARAATVYEVASPSQRADYLPRLSDVSMRSLSPRPETLPLAAAFHVTRLDWVYPGTDTDWMEDVVTAGLKLQPTLNANMNDGPGRTTRDQGRMVDVHGQPITAPWMTWSSPWWGCANQRAYHHVWRRWAEYYAARQVESMQHDDPAMNGSAVFWQPGTNPSNNTGPGCFGPDCLFNFHLYLRDQGRTAWHRDYPVNRFADTFLAGRGFTVFLVSRSSTGLFGISGTTANGDGAVPRLYLRRASMSYNALDNIPLGADDGTWAITTYVHNGSTGAATFLDGVRKSAVAVPVVSSFGEGGHLAIPFQSGGANVAGEIAELVVYDRLLSLAEIHGVSGYLGEQYGIVSGDPVSPDEGELAYPLKLWLQAASLDGTYRDGDPVTHWTARAGFDATVPAVTLPNGQTAGPPTFTANAVNGKPAVQFDGVDDLLGVSWFSMKAYVLEHVDDQNLRLAPPAIRTPFQDFQKQSVRWFLETVGGELDAFAGRHVPLSCNGRPATGATPYDLFDFGINELHESNARPGYLWDQLHRTAEAGKAQVFTMPKVRGFGPVTDWDTDYPTLRTLTRKAIATCYAFGGHMMVPWDNWMPEGNPRYFGTPQDYAHLFKLVRDHPVCFDGYDDAFVTGYDVSDDRYADPQPIELQGGSGQVCASVRVQAGNPDAPAVIHLVEWEHANPQSIQVAIDHSRFFGARAHQVEVVYHDLQTNRSHSVTHSGSRTTVTVPALSTWALLVVTPGPWPPRTYAARWQFEETTLDTGGVHHGTPHNNPGYAIDRREGNHAIALDGMGQYVEVADHHGLDFGTGDFTVSAWIRKRRPDPMIVVSKGNGFGDPAEWSFGWGDDQIAFRSDNHYFYTAPHSISNTWHHVAFVRAGSNGFCYVDGLLSGGPYAMHPTHDFVNDEPLRIGRREYAPMPTHFDGTIDDLRLYDWALSGNEIASLGDSDQDGMPDGWEKRFFGDIHHADAHTDEDGDHATDVNEYHAGTNPTNAASVFQAAGIAPGSIETRVSWSSETGRHYAVQRSDNTGGPFSVVASNLAATPPRNTYADQPVSNLDRATYRFEVE